jgi:predicted TIM-barrel fold metal-dependent hydrolase
MKHSYFVIDMHAHIGDPEIPRKIGEKAINNPRVRHAFEGIQKLQQDVGWEDGMVALNPSPQHFVQVMQESGTDLAVLSMLGFTEELEGIELCSSDMIATILQEYPGKFLGFAGVDPRLSDAAQRIEMYVKEKGFSGAKLNPNDWGIFRLDDPMLIPIFEKCNDLGVPLHIHTGVDPTGLIENANPLLLDKIALQYPQLKILLEHYGFPFKYEAYAMCRKHEHVYLTLAWHFNKLVHHNRYLAWLELEEMRIHAGIGKILYGSDYPATPNLKEVINFLKYDHMPLMLQFSGVKDWTYEMRAQVLGLNAAGILDYKNEHLMQLRNRFKKEVGRVELSMQWNQEALAQLQKIPPFIRSGAIGKIEGYAKKKGIKLISPEVMQKARNQ